MDKVTSTINFIFKHQTLSMRFTFFINGSCFPLSGPMDAFISRTFTFIVLGKFQNSVAFINNVSFVFRQENMMQFKPFIFIRRKKTAYHHWSYTTIERSIIIIITIFNQLIYTRQHFRISWFTNKNGIVHSPQCIMYISTKVFLVRQIDEFKSVYSRIFRINVNPP